MKRMVKSFLSFAGCIFAVTGALKLIATVGEQKFLSLSDPLFPFVSIRLIFFVAATMELGIVGLLLSKAGQKAKLAAVAWVCSVFSVYRIGLWSIGYQGPCRCLGGEWALLRIKPEYWERLVVDILFFMLLISWALFVRELRASDQNRVFLNQSNRDSRM